MPVRAGNNSRSMAANALRLYGVMDADDSAGADLKLDGVSLIVFRDLAAVVTAAPYIRTHPGDAELADYVRVIDAVYKLGPVVPAPPATIFRDRGVLERWMDIHYAKLHEALGVIERRENPNPPYDYVRMDLTS